VRGTARGGGTLRQQRDRLRRRGRGVDAEDASPARGAGAPERQLRRGGRAHGELAGGSVAARRPGVRARPRLRRLADGRLPDGPLAFPVTGFAGRGGFRRRLPIGPAAVRIEGAADPEAAEGLPTAGIAGARDLSHGISRTFCLKPPSATQATLLWPVLG